MEFYRRVESKCSAAQLQALITLEQLPSLCASIDTLLEQRGEEGQIYCVWGAFEVTRQKIRDGVRFTLPGCINALAWTITANPDHIVIHCTINRAEHDQDFIESIEQFVEDWRTGLAEALNPGQ
ncbi:hypothetical protein [Sedimenticola thiotaurini]|uniref:Uncharacterized protein n=1 Tax=Sedimenticola thiotaurini TaxID=1543721 RepID=A0A0F7K0L3_9GAMM|nr:hypothetical protein [Sedimenticola thiotaurini]AKH20553.1 hypothetical protein AAY24_09515 [Sedimenticola thiotaurini]